MTTPAPSVASRDTVLLVVELAAVLLVVVGAVLLVVVGLVGSLEGKDCLVSKSCFCHASAEQSNARLLPLPVGLSSKALSPLLRA